MEFFSPVPDIFTEQKEFTSIIKKAKDCQLNYSIEKIKEFNFLDNKIVSEILPPDTPEAILDRRKNIKYL